MIIYTFTIKIKIGGNRMLTSDSVVARISLYGCAIGAQRNLPYAARLRSSAVAIAIFKNSYLLN